MSFIFEGVAMTRGDTPNHKNGILGKTKLELPRQARYQAELGNEDNED